MGIFGKYEQIHMCPWPQVSNLLLVLGLIDDYWGFRCVDPRVSFPFIGIHNVVRGVCIQSKSRILKLLYKQALLHLYLHTHI